MENELTKAADALCVEAQKRADRMWNNGHYTDAIYLYRACNEYLEALKNNYKAKNTIENSVLIS